MIENPKKHERPGTACDSTGPQNKNHTETLARLAREITAILAIGLMVGTMFWSAVFGMAADLPAGPLDPGIVQADGLAVASGGIGE